MIAPRCSVVITAYNSAHDLPECLDALLAQDTVAEIVLVDNASDDSTPEICERYQSQITCVRLSRNRAVAGGYNAGAQAARGEILIFVNADTIAQQGWMSELLRPFDDPKVGMTTSRILLADAPHLVNACGNDVTWTGITLCRGLGEPSSAWQTASEVTAVSGASFAVRRDLFERLGGFDETMQFYLDDTDLSLRARLAGYDIRYVPESAILHKYRFNPAASRMFYQERNRWLMMLKLLRARTLLLLAPGLLLGELIAWVYCARQGRGYLQAKADGWKWLWANRSLIASLRSATQARRIVRDQDLLRRWSPQLHISQVLPGWQGQLADRITEPLLVAYGALCRTLVVW